MIRAARWQIRQNGWLCLESRDRPREGRTGRVLIAGCQTAGYRHSQRRVVCTSRERVDESAAELEGRKSLPSPVDWPKMNEGGCTGPENEMRRKGLSTACLLDAFCCSPRERLDACKFGLCAWSSLAFARGLLLRSHACDEEPIEENSLRISCIFYIRPSHTTHPFGDAVCSSPSPYPEL